MDAVLGVITVGAFSLAIGLGVIGWKLLRGARQDVAARAEALRTLATLPDALVPAPEENRIGRLPEAVSTETAEEAAIRQPHVVRDPLTDWDATLGRSLYIPPEAAETAIFEAAAHIQAPAWRRRLLAVIGLVMVASAGTVYALHREQSLETRHDESNGLMPATTIPLDLLSLSETVDADGTFKVTGLVGNPADGHSVRGVVAVVYLFDREGHYFATGRAAIDAALFAPGDQSPFVVKVPHGADAVKYRVGFRDPEGGVVPHIDKRGQTIAGTTEGEAPSRGPGH